MEVILGSGAVGFGQGEALTRDITGCGPEDADIVFLTDFGDENDLAAGYPLAGYLGRMFNNHLQRVGLRRSRVRVEAVIEEVPHGLRTHYQLGSDRLSMWRADALKRLKALGGANLIVTFGELACELVTGHRSVDKWHLSVVRPVFGLSDAFPKAMPIFHPRRILRAPKDSPFFILGFERLRDEMRSPAFSSTSRTFHTNPTYAEVLAFLKKCETSEWLSVDIETGRGQITCLGVGASPTEAMCVPTLPGQWPNADEFFGIWQAITRALESKVSKKVLQNYIYDATYLSRYGIRIENIFHDTMWAQKFLHPELPMGLDTIARVYTREPYWKDDAKDWGLRQDIEQLWTYNCRDVSVTLEACFAQRVDLEQRGLTDLFYNYLMKLSDPITEMCWRGLPICEETLSELRTKQEQELKEATDAFDKVCRAKLDRTINPRSPKQLKDAFKEMRFRLPTKDGKESTDVRALTKLRKRYPKEPLIPALLKIRKSGKLLESYLRFKYSPDKRLRFSINGHGTETGRFSAYKDPFDNGLNPQTIPKRLRKFVRTSPEHTLIQVDLAQAESRFVAWDGPVPRLMQFLTEGRDVHKYVAGRIFNKPETDITDKERQLGKKSGHAANYMVGPNTFADACLTEMDLVLNQAEANRILESYHSSFPEIRSCYQKKVIDEVRSTKSLTTPLGRQRQFYDRIGDSLFREACAYKPQSTIPDIINHLMLFLYGKAPLLLQMHDSLLFEVPNADVSALIREMRKINEWYPKITLAGGDLVIPIDIEQGDNWGELEKVTT